MPGCSAQYVCNSNVPGKEMQDGKIALHGVPAWCSHDPRQTQSSAQRPDTIPRKSEPADELGVVHCYEGVNPRAQRCLTYDSSHAAPKHNSE